jgi:ParB family transcriptional regulator, chromosome partitioning protein
MASCEDIAARFGVTAAVVRQRLKLGAVSPKLRALYRKGEMNLDQLSAFAITDDHAGQERVWAELPTYSRGREAILHLLSEGQIRSDDRRALFVGAKAYEAAGGSIIRDLFDSEGGGFFADAELLNRLVREKLQQHAEKVAAEGWRWVMAEPERDHEASAGMRRVFAKPVPLSKAERKRLHKLDARYKALFDKYPDGDVPPEAAAKMERIEAAVEALQKAEYKPQDVARAGAFVTLDREGGVRIERGFVRPENEPHSKAAKKQAGKSVEDGPAPLSERLVADLTAQRTAALRNELAIRPDVALIAAVYTLAAATFFAGTSGLSCLHIVPRTMPLAVHAQGIEESPAWRQMAVRHEIWIKRMPSEPEGLWKFVKELSESDRLALLAHCVALTVNAVQAPGHRGIEGGEHAEVLARELALGMSTYWQPTVENYLGRVSKERICEAVREGVSDDAAKNIATLRKAAMADAAAERLAGKNWLPTLLRPAA